MINWLLKKNNSRYGAFYGWNPLQIISMFSVIISAVIWLLWMIFDTTEYQIRVDKISASYSGQWKENYSETTTGFDMEGNLSTDTDYWTEPGGTPISLRVENNVVTYRSAECVVTNPGAMAVCRKNMTWHSHKALKRKTNDFDNHSWKDSHNFSMYLMNSETNQLEQKNLTVSEYFYLSNNIGEMVTVGVNHFGSIFIKF